jgi:hypothetical protein
MQDEIPESVARVIGYVCGVIAVGMATLGLLSIWALAHKPSVLLMFAALFCGGLSLLMFRWAGALLGRWDTRDRLVVSKFFYSAFGALLVGLVLFSIAATSVRPPQTLDEGLLVVTGISGGVALIYLCYLAYRRFR